jgi:hypothetical protein
MPYNSISKYQLTSTSSLSHKPVKSVSPALPPLPSSPPLTVIPPPPPTPLYQEKPQTEPIADQVSPPLKWKTIILVGVIMFFAGTITGVSLMLFLY